MVKKNSNIAVNLINGVVQLMDNSKNTVIKECKDIFYDRDFVLTNQ